MSGGALRLGRVLGFEIRLDYSWFIIFVLVTWSLAVGYLPESHPDWSIGTYWLIGAVTSVLFFASVLIHELAHSTVSRLQGVPVHDITLFIFGGASHISREPRRPRDEFFMALVGPASSLVLAALLAALWAASFAWEGPLHASFGWLAQINLILGVFNLVPGFPLDGGRVLRAIVWSATGSLKRATRIVSYVGSVVAYGLIFWGILQVFNGNLFGGLWMAFIGWFLKDAAAGSYQQVALQEVLAGHKVTEIMMTDCPKLPPHLTLDTVVEHAILPSGRRCFPVQDNGRIYGLLTLHNIKDVPRDRWTTTRVEEVMIPAERLKTLGPDDELNTAMERMAAEDVNQLPVVADGQLLGIVARENVLWFLQLHGGAEKPTQLPN